MATFHQLLGITVLLQCTHIFLGENTTPTPPTPKPKTTRTTLSYFNYLKAKRMKKMHFEYYPNYGYEPYWADGEWMLSTTTAVYEGGSTTKIPKICGEECSHLLRMIKYVCARQSGDTAYASNACGSIGPVGRCTGFPGDDFSPGYHTFRTYCEFLNAECHSKFYNDSRWVLVHVGKCQHLDNYFKPLWESDQPVSRMKWFLSSLGTE